MQKERAERYYKAFDFKTGNTYLIGKHKSKSDAEAYCKTQGYTVIAQTVVPLTEEEYFRAYENRKDPEQRDERIEDRRMEISDKKTAKVKERERHIKSYQHEYYERVTKPKRQAKKIGPEGRNGGENGTEVLRDQ